MEHVGVAEHDVGPAADRAPGILRRIAVVCEHADLNVVRSGGPCPPAVLLGEALGKRLQLRKLILRERFRGKEVQRARGRISKHRIEDRYVVAERLAGSRRRDDDDVSSGEGVRERLGLVRIELRGASHADRGAQAGVRLLGKRRIPGFDRRHPLDRGNDRLSTGCLGATRRLEPRENIPQAAVLIRESGRERQGEEMVTAWPVAIKKRNRPRIARGIR